MTDFSGRFNSFERTVFSRAPTAFHYGLLTVQDDVVSPLRFQSAASLMCLFDTPSQFFIFRAFAPKASF